VNLFTKNFKDIFFGYFFYKLFVAVILWNILYYWVLNFINLEWLMNNWNWLDSASSIFWSTAFIIWVNIFLIFMLLNLIFIVPFILWTIKSIKEAYLEKENIDFIDNIKYGFKSLYESFKTYWYMFAYVALIPLIILIVWGVLVIIGQYQNIDLFLQIWWYVSWFGIMLLIIFSIYRWIKTSFSITRAVDYNDYSKESFKESVLITDNKWLRIVGNFILIWILISIIWWIINWLIWIFKFSVSDFDYSSFLALRNWNLSQENIQNIISEFTKWAWEFSLKSLIFEIIDLLIKTIFTIFTFIFTYVFYKRLELEKSWNNKVVENNIKIEKNIEL